MQITERRVRGQAEKFFSVQPHWSGTIDLVIEVFTNKQMVVILYLDKGRVYDTLKSEVIVKSKAPWR